MKDNKHAQAIPQEVLTQAQTKINEVAALLAPYFVALTPAASVRAAKPGRRPSRSLSSRKQSMLKEPNSGLKAPGLSLSDQKLVL
jgi:hypothetical protein